jgi:hypothetical protein
MCLFQERYKLYDKQMVAQLRSNKEMCIFHNCFHYFVRPLYIGFLFSITTCFGCLHQPSSCRHQATVV